MSNIKFTPGPWQIEEADGNEQNVYLEVATEDDFICGVYIDSAPESKERAIYDARLIAAAPEMYEILQTLIEHPTCNKELPLPKRIIELFNKINE